MVDTAFTHLCNFGLLRAVYHQNSTQYVTTLYHQGSFLKPYVIVSTDAEDEDELAALVRQHSAPETADAQAGVSTAELVAMMETDLAAVGPSTEAPATGITARDSAPLGKSGLGEGGGGRGAGQ